MCKCIRCNIVTKTGDILESEIAEKSYQSKVYNCQTQVFSETTLGNCYSCIEANIQAN